MTTEGEVAIGFEGLEETESQKSYTVQFSASDPEPDDDRKKSEQIVLLERSEGSPVPKGEEEDPEKVSFRKHCSYKRSI